MIYYSHVNEDNRVERRLLKESKMDTVVAVAGSGERVLSLMDFESVNQFDIVDVNEEAIYLLQLKLAALKALPVMEYLAFIGHHDTKGEIRLGFFQKIKENLETLCHDYWEAHQTNIAEGILFAGHFEQFLQRVRKPTNFFLGENFHTIFSNNPTNEKNFPSFRWNLVRTLFSSKLSYKLWGNKDPAFISKDSDTSMIPVAINKIIENNEASSSFMMHLIFKGHLQNMHKIDTPPSLDADVLSAIKKRLAAHTIKINFHVKDILGFIREQPKNTSCFYSISDVLSFETPAYISQIIHCTQNTNSLLVWRAFLKNRTSQAAATKLSDLSEYESTGMYQVYSLQQSINE